MRLVTISLLGLFALASCGPSAPPPPTDATPGDAPAAHDAPSPLDDTPSADNGPSDAPAMPDRAVAPEASPGDDAGPADASATDALSADTSVTPDASSTDASAEATSDVAPASDAVTDAPATDVPAMDAPAMDVSAMDATVDVVPTDAPADASAPDAPYMLPSPPVAVAPDPDAPYPAVTLTPPDPRFDTMTATRTVGGVEFVDPAGVLAGLTVTVTALDVATLSPALPSALAAWDLGPSGTLSGVVYARFPLPSPRAPGEILLLWTQDPDAVGPPWFTESVARVTPDGAHALVALQHFSPHVLTLDTPEGAAFIAGAPCTALLPGDAGDAGDASASDASYLTTVDVPFAFNSAWPTASETAASASAGPIEVAYSHDVGRRVLTRLSSDPRIAATVAFANNDPVPWDDEDSFGDPALVEPLARLGALVHDRSCGALTLRVTEGFDSRHEHSDHALHYEGRALDLTLALVSDPGSPASASAAAYSLGLSRLALLATEAGFAWVNNETSRLHVHVSMPRSTSLSGAARATAVAPVRDHGVAGAVRTRGANGDATHAPGNGGAVTFQTVPTFPAPSPGTATPFVSIPAGTMATALPPTMSAARIAGTVTLSANTSVVVTQSFYLAPGGSIVCHGCDLTITTRGVAVIEGTIDLSATATGASRNGGALTVTQWRDSAPVFLLPSVDARGGDGGDGGGTSGGTGGAVTVNAVGDMVLGNDMDRASVLTVLGRADHTAQGGTSWQVLAPGITDDAVIVTSGGVGSASESLFAGSAGGAGGHGGDVSIAVSNDALGLFGRASFYRAFIATGGTPGDATASPLELYRITDITRRVGPFTMGVGSAGGRGAQSFASVSGGNGGVGGDGGALLLAADRARACPAYDLATPFTVTGVDDALTDIGTGMRASGPGACALVYMTVGGSGGANGGSGTGFPGFAGHHGASGMVMLP